VATQVHSASPVNAVSILSALRPQPPQPAPPALPLPNPQAAITAAFQGQLIAAIADRNGGAGDAEQPSSKQGYIGKDVKRPGNKKSDDGPQQPVVAAAATMPQLPPPPVATFGLPSAGVEPGPDHSDRLKAAPESNPAPVVDEPALNVSLDSTPVPPLAEPPQAPLKAKLAAASDLAPTRPPAASSEFSKPESHTELAFALKLVSEPSKRTVQSPAKIAAPTVAPVLTPAEIPSAPALAVAPGPAPSAPEIGAAPVEGVQPVPAIQPGAPARPAPARVLSIPLIAPLVAPVTIRGGGAPESKAHSREDASPNKDARPAASRPQQSPPSETKFQRPSSAVPEMAIHAESASRPDTSSPAMLSIAPAPAASSTPQPLSAPPAPSPVEPISEPAVTAPRPATATQVTDVSVTVPIPRPDATADDRIAIRMVQKGAEIHVSVRTPDTQLAQSVRQDLGKLSTGLDQAGFRTETWRPVAANPAVQSSADPQRDSSQGNPKRDGNAQDSRSGGQGGGSFGEQRRRQPDARPGWVAELDEQSKP
jgi:hypothetical protein